MKFIKEQLAMVFVLTILAGLVYFVTQQNLRMGANDPQVQIAQDFARQFSLGQKVNPISPSLAVDAGESLSPFILILDDSGNVITGSGRISDQYPKIPLGVLETARKNGQNRVTWQPQPGLRFAAVVVHYGGPTPGFVVAARSLAEVEQREQVLFFQALAFWIVGMLGLFALGVFRGKIQ